MMTNEKAMHLMTELGLHTGGLENWVEGNAWMTFADSAVDDFKTRLADAIEKMPFGDTAASFAQFVREFK